MHRQNKTNLRRGMLSPGADRPRPIMGGATPTGPEEEALLLKEPAVGSKPEGAARSSSRKRQA